MGIDPFSIAIGSMIAGGVVSAAGSVVQGFAGRNAANYRAAVAKNNAAIAEQEAANVGAQTARQVEEEAYRVNQTLGSMRAERGASGVALDTGSAALAERSSRLLGLRSIGNVYDAGSREAAGLRAQADMFRGEAKLAKSEASLAIPTALIGATGSLLSSAGNVGLAYADLARSGEPFDPSGFSLAAG